MDFRITLRELLEVLNNLPDFVKDKRIDYLDLAYLTKEDLETFKQNLLKLDPNSNIGLCQN